MSEQIIPIEASDESVEVQDLEMEVLDEATEEPEAYIEENGSYEESEAVQENFEMVVDTSMEMMTEEAAAAAPEAELEADEEEPVPSIEQDSVPAEAAAGQVVFEAVLDTSMEAIAEEAVVAERAAELEADEEEPVPSIEQDTVRAGGEAVQVSIEQTAGVELPTLVKEAMQAEAKEEEQFTSIKEGAADAGEESGQPEFLPGREGIPSSSDEESNQPEGNPIYKEFTANREVKASEVQSIPGVMEEVPVEAPAVSLEEGQIQPGQMPEEAVPLAGMGTRGGVDAAGPIAPEMPVNTPEGTTGSPYWGQGKPGNEPGGEGNSPGSQGQPGGFWTPGGGIVENLPDTLTDAGSGMVGSGEPKVIGNMPGRHGQQPGSSGTPEVGNYGDMPDMPTSGGTSSSGGGPPVNNYGGQTGDSAQTSWTFVDWWGQKDEGSSTSSSDAGGACDSANKWAKDAIGSASKDYTSSAKITVKCDNGVTTTYTYKAPEKAYTVDGGSTVPYTGGGFSSGTVKPEKDNDTGRVIPKITPDGHGGVVTGGDVDGTDDTGRFYGGIMGGYRKVYPDSGGARPIDPIRAEADEVA